MKVQCDCYSNDSFDEQGINWYSITFFYCSKCNNNIWFYLPDETSDDYKFFRAIQKGARTYDWNKKEVSTYR